MTAFDLLDLGIFSMFAIVAICLLVALSGVIICAGPGEDEDGWQ